MSSCDLGIVIIGRNEGERLERCFASLNREYPAVYVDSGSTDNSVAMARQFGIEVANLELPFTAAHGRNEGFKRLMKLYPDLELVQFVDGDCEVQPGWLEAAQKALRDQADAGAVSGRRRERFPEASLYNRLCDLEWARKPGVAETFGGDVMIRTDAFEKSGGYTETMIAGEDPELGFRIHRDGWKIIQLADEMTLHDANILRFGQWWRRMIRGGHAYAESAAMHGRGPERYCVRQTISAILFGAVMPGIFVISMALAIWRVRFLWLAIVPVLAWVRLIFASYQWRRSLGDPAKDSCIYGLMMVPTKIAEAVGVMRFFLNRARGRRTGLIEYKGASAAA